MILKNLKLVKFEIKEFIYLINRNISKNKNKLIFEIIHIELIKKDKPKANKQRGE